MGVTKAIDEGQVKGAKKKVLVAEVVRSGEAIIIPEKATLQEVIDNLERRKQYEEEEIQLSEIFDAFPWDGAYSLKLALEKKYGVFMQEGRDFFGMKIPPAVVSIETGYDEDLKRPVLEQVPWGDISVPAIGKDGKITTGAAPKNGRISFVLAATMKRKYEVEFRALCEEIRTQLQEHSIYRRKAFTVRFKSDNGKPLPMPMPKFISTRGLSAEQLVFPKVVEDAIATNIYTPIEMADELGKLGMKFKRGVGLAGPYGTGKTSVATVVSALATKHGMTYILCQRADEFVDAMKFASLFGRTVVFCEDIDRALDGERTVKVDDILNTIDGVESKSSEIMVILTTNNIENIHQAMLRPGRLDAIIDMKRPDAEATERLIRLYGKGIVEDGADLTEVSEQLAGNIPAVIAECVQRAKLAQLRHSKTAQGLLVSSAALKEAADTMQMQLDLLQPKPEAEHDPEGRIKAARIVAGALQDQANTWEKKLPKTINSSTAAATLPEGGTA